MNSQSTDIDTATVRNRALGLFLVGARALHTVGHLIAEPIFASSALRVVHWTKTVR